MKNFAIPCALVLVICLTIPPTCLAAAERKLSGEERVAKDPQIVVLVRLENLMTPVEGVLDLVTRINKDVTAEKIESGFAEIEEELGFPLRDDLLAQLGPEFGLVIDLPPLDTVAELAAGFPGTASSILAGSGLFAQLRDAEKVDRSLRKLAMSEEGAEVVEGDDGLIRLRFPATAPGTGADSAVEFVYGIRDGWLAVGMNADWVESTLTGPDKGQRLSDGADYARVMSHLDIDPYLRAYVNLPALLDAVQNSNMLKAALGASDGGRGMMEAFVNDEYFGMGWGYTSIELDGGTRASTFGSTILTGAGMYTGIVAAVAIPNFINATDRGKQKRTMADLRSIGTAIETFNIDNNRYPATDGWQTAEALTGSLQPVYIRNLPQKDGWGHEFHVLSDGESYVLVSAGKDGELDRDWTEPGEVGATNRFDSDIVFSNGQFLSWPEGTQQ